MADNLSFEFFKYICRTIKTTDRNPNTRLIIAMIVYFKTAFELSEIK